MMKKMKNLICAAGVVLLSGTLASPAEARPQPGKRDAWQDCMALCLLVAFWPPGVAAWAAGCTAGYAKELANNPRPAGGPPPGKAPRFNKNVGYTPGTETILYTPGDTVTLSAGVWEFESDDYVDSSMITSVQFSVVDFFDLFAANDFDDAPWMLVGSGVFNTENSMYETDWMPNVIPQLGWAIRADISYMDGYDIETLALNGAGLIPTPTATLVLSIGMLGFCRRRR